MSGFELPLLSFLAVSVASVLARMVFLHARIARRARELESELARRREVEVELEGTYRDLQRRFVERTQALEERNEELTRPALRAGNREPAAEASGRRRRAHRHCEPPSLRSGARA
jgi:hypothetical protein